MSVVRTKPEGGVASCAGGGIYTRHYINLSNGVEAIDGLLSAGVAPEALGVCRIQSSQCESQDFSGLLANLDHDMMLHLALGHECRVYDFGSRGSTWVADDGFPRWFHQYQAWLKPRDGKFAPLLLLLSWHGCACGCCGCCGCICGHSLGETPPLVEGVPSGGSASKG